MPPKIENIEEVIDIEQISGISDVRVATSSPSKISGPDTDDCAKQRRWIVLGLLHIVAGWALSIVIFGIPGLYIPAVMMVPVIMGLLVLMAKP